MELQPADVGVRVEAIGAQLLKESCVSVVIAVVGLETFVVQACQNRARAEDEASEGAPVVVGGPLDSCRFEEVQCRAQWGRWLPASLPVGVQVQPREARRVERTCGADAALILIGEQLVAHPTERLLAGASRAGVVGVQKVRAQLEVEPGPMGNALAEHLDAE